MGNKMSTGSESQNQITPYLNDSRVATEIQMMIAKQLCPVCSMDEDVLPSAQEARELQRALVNLAATCKHLHAVANEHLFHSFVMPQDPDFNNRPDFHHDLGVDIALAQRFNNRGLPNLLDRLITDPGLGQKLQYVAIRDFMLQLKAGVTKARLQRFMAASTNLGIQIPTFVPGLLLLPDFTMSNIPFTAPGDRLWIDGELWILVAFGQVEHIQFDIWLVRLLLFGLAPLVQKLMVDPEIAKMVFLLDNPPAATLPSVITMGVPQFPDEHGFMFADRTLQMEVLLRRFPNLRAFQNDEVSMAWHRCAPRPANAPPLFPNLRRLVLAAEQPGRLHHLTQVLWEFPNLEELYYHRRTGLGVGEDDPNFSNANAFNAARRSLRRLTYSSAMVRQRPDDNDYYVDIRCYAERRFSEVQRFRDFAVLEDLSIDQALLGRMATIRDRVDSPTGPYYPDIDYTLPQSLRRLTIKFVYDLPELASQLSVLALAKNSGQFPFLTDIFVVIVDDCTITFGGTWPLQIPLGPRAGVIHALGLLLKASGIRFGASATEIEPPAAENEVEEQDYPNNIVPAGTLIAFNVQRRSFPRI